MTVYVDGIRRYNTQLRYKDWCHMTADSDEELHEMADKIGLKREWFQPHASNPFFNHYDLVPSKRALALRHGAVEETSRDLVRRSRQAGLP